MTTGDGALTRRWRLRAWRAGDTDKKPFHDDTVLGDEALDVALAKLEHDREVVRTAVSDA